MAHNDTMDIISSSPEFPDLFAPVAKAPPKKPTLRTGSNITPILNDAVGFGTFTSAASIWRLSQVVDEEKPAHKSPPRPTTTKETPTIATSVSTITVEVSTTTPTTAVSEEKPAKKPRKPRKKKETTTTVIDENAPPKPPARRGRPPKSKDVDGQTALPKPKVTKPAAKSRTSRKKAETLSKHFAAASARASTADAPVPEEPSKAPAAPKPVTVRIEIGPIDLEPADRRRLDWTPPPDDRPPPAAGNSSTIKELPYPTTAQTEPPVAFGKLLDTYGCKPENDQPSEVTKADVLGKRKLLEMVATSITTADKPTSPETSPIKTKAPKKKPRTITDLATAAYRIQDPVDDSASTLTSKQDTLLGYIDVEDDKAATKPSGAKTKAASKKPAKPRVSKKKPEPRKQLLLSPQSALRQVSGQDFVFGTSSQLVTEDTDLLRALHESMKTAGNAPDSDPFTSSPVKFSNLASRCKTGNNKLWKVGARDEYGDLLDLEVFDLTEAVEVPEDLLQQAHRPSVGVPEKTKAVEQVDDKTERTIEILSSDPVVPERPTITRPDIHISTLSAKGKETAFCATKPPPPPNLVVPPRARTPQIARSLSRESTPPQPKVITRAKTPPRPTTPPRASAVLDFDFDFDDYEPPPSNQEHYQLLEQSQKTASPSKTQQQHQQQQQRQQQELQQQPQPQPQKKMDPPPPPRPKYELFTDAQLSREIASYGFKPIKRRAAMLSLLAKCWDSKMGVDPIAVSPGRERGQTKKGINVQEAEEAGIKVVAAPAAKKPRGRPKKTLAPVATASPSRSTTNKPEKAAAAAAGPAHRTTASTSKTAPIPVMSASTPKRQRISVLEIPDSDIDDSDFDPFASSPLLASSPDASPSASQLFSTPEKYQAHNHDAAEMSLLTECEESLLDITPSTSTEADLFKHITQAITTAPRTNNPSEPSWHEKILMYDPIILEDLTGWLNTAGQGLDSVGWEGEAGTDEVRRWCESKGVGWVWREGNRGQVRKRF